MSDLEALVNEYLETLPDDGLEEICSSPRKAARKVLVDGFGSIDYNWTIKPEFDGFLKWLKEKYHTQIS